MIFHSKIVYFKDIGLLPWQCISPQAPLVILTELFGTLVPYISCVVCPHQVPNPVLRCKRNGQCVWAGKIGRLALLDNVCSHIIIVNKPPHGAWAGGLCTRGGIQTLWNAMFDIYQGLFISHVVCFIFPLPSRSTYELILAYSHLFERWHCTEGWH